MLSVLQIRFRLVDVCMSIQFAPYITIKCTHISDRIDLIIIWIMVGPLYPTSQHYIHRFSIYNYLLYQKTIQDLNAIQSTIIPECSTRCHNRCLEACNEFSLHS